tara:strand:- start:791 stop:1204 length:414 start_codon:yes stop_codon:yes gene_type:complete
MNTRQTSIDCYNEIKANGLLSKRRLEVYEAILKNAPCTSNEALEDVYSGSHGIGSRTSELRGLGVIYEKGIRKCRVTGRNVIEWDLTDSLPINFKNNNKTKKQKIDDAINSLRELYKNKNNNTSEDWKIVADLIKII